VAANWRRARVASPAAGKIVRGDGDGRTEPADRGNVRKEDEES
jgi:hypothetical protein